MYCVQCGQQLEGAAKFCVKCGTRVADVEPTDTVVLARPDASPEDAPRSSAEEAKVDFGASATTGAAVAPARIGEPARYAGFWRRVGASFIDSLLIGIAVALLGLLLGWDFEDESLGWPDAVSVLVTWLYFALLHSSAAQATPGKRLFGIKVTSEDGERIGFGHASVRHFAQILSALTLGIGYLMAGFTRRKQALHDIVASTLVVTRDASPSEVRAGLAAPRLGGAVVVVLLAVVLVLGVLAAIAVPAYDDYMVRAQVQEGLDVAQPYREAVTKALEAGSDPADIDNETIGLPEDQAHPYVASVDVAGGLIQVTFGKEAQESLGGASLTLVPGFDGTGSVEWTCGVADPADGVEPIVDSYFDYTSVETKHLPAECR